MPWRVMPRSLAISGTPTSFSPSPNVVDSLSGVYHDPGEKQQLASRQAANIATVSPCPDSGNSKVQVEG